MSSDRSYAAVPRTSSERERRCVTIGHVLPSLRLLRLVHRDGRYRIGAALAMAALLSVADAKADDKRACIDANEKAQQLKDEQKLLSARAEVLACAREVCPGPVRKDCTELLEDINRRIPSIVVRARRGGNDVLGVISIDGKVFTGSVGQPIEMDPGPHRLRVKVDDIESEQQISAVQGEHQRLVVVDLAEPIEKVTPRQTEADTINADKGTRGGTQRAVGIATGVVGLAGIAIGSVFGVMAMGDKDTQLANCSSTSCPNRTLAESAHNDAVSAGLVSTISLVAGGVLFAAGVVVFVTAPKAPVRVGWSPSGIVLAGVFP